MGQSESTGRYDGQISPDLLYYVWPPSTCDAEPHTRRPSQYQSPIQSVGEELSSNRGVSTSAVNRSDRVHAELTQIVGRKRRESESTTSTATTSTTVTTENTTATDSTIPATVTDSSLHNSTELEYLPSHIERTFATGIARHEFTRTMDLSISRHESSTQNTQDRHDSDIQHRSVHAQGYSKDKASHGLASKKDKRFKIMRRTSDSSASVASDRSGQSPRILSKGLKGRRISTAKGKGDLKLKEKSLAAKHERASSLDKKWQHMVDEYQQTYISQETQNKGKSEFKGMKVSKISNFDKYDNVKQVFGKRMPLPMQRAHPSFKNDELETESLPSESSLKMWSPTYHGKSSSHMDVERKSRQAMGVSYATPVEAVEMQSRNASSSEKKVVSKKEKSERLRKDKKSNRKGMEEAASEIVDDVIDKALSFLESSSKSKTKYSKTRASTSTKHSTDDDTPVNAIISDRRKSKAIHRQSIDKVDSMLDYSNGKKALRMSQSPTPYGQGRGSRDRRKSSIHPVAMSGRSRPLSPASPPTRSWKTYSTDTSVGVYDARDLYSSPRNTKFRSLGSPERNTQYSSDSEYSTTLEIRRPDSRQECPAERSHSWKYTERPPKSNTSRQRKVNPPTITRGSVTRVMHEFGESLYGPKETNLPPNKIETQSDTIEYNTQTWPLQPSGRTTINLEKAKCVEQYQPAYSTLPIGFRGNSSNNRFISQPKIVVQEIDSQLPAQIAVDNTDTSEQSVRLTLGSEDQESRKETYSMPTPKSQQVNLFINASKLVENSSTENSSPQHILHIPGSHGREYSSQGIILPVIAEENEETQYGAFSNEPLIIADLMGRENQGLESSVEDQRHIIWDQGGAKFYGTQPAVSMNKRQTLNFYVFNQQQSDGSDSTRRELPVLPEGQEYPNSRFETETELQEVLIHHKQTQTPSHSSKQPHKSKHVEVKQTKKQQLKPKSSPKPQSNLDRVSHTETTHYITKQREVEKLQPEKMMSDSGVQTDSYHVLEPKPVDKKEKVYRYSGKLFTPYEDNVDTNHYLSQISQSKQFDSVDQSKLQSAEDTCEGEECHYHDETIYTNTMPLADGKPFISEIREVEQRRDVFETPKTQLKEIPIIIDEDEQSELIQLIEETPQTNNVSEYKEIIVSSEKQGVSPEESEEEEIIETTIVEEKEEKISMAIYEELEFYFQKSQGGQTTSQKMHSTDIEPWWRPEKYEACCDKRKQKMTQRKEIMKEGTQSMRNDSVSLPAIDDVSCSESNIFTTTNAKYISEEDSEIKSKADSLKNETFFDSNIQFPLKMTSETITSNDNYKNQTANVITPEKANFMTEKTMYIGPREGVQYETNKTSKEYRNTTALSTENVFGPRSTSSTVVLPNANVEVNSAYTNESLPDSLDHFEENISEQKVSKSYSGRTVSNDTIPSSKSKSSGYKEVRRSTYDPYNVSFGRKSGQELLKESEEMAFDLDAIIQSAEAQPVVETKEMIIASSLDSKVVHSSQTEPLLKTRIEKDKDGNLVKITELQQTLTKTVEYNQDKAEEEKPKNIDINSLKSEDCVHTEIESIRKESITSSDVVGDIAENVSYVGPDVKAETSVSLKPVHFDVQEWSLKVNDSNLDIPLDQQYLYDMHTAELKPVHTKNNQDILVQYSLGDTMITEL